MKTKKITDAEMTPLRIASLPTRPTAQSSFGGGGYSSSELKAAFDKLPELIAARLNTLIDDINDGSLTSALPTGLTSPKTLGDFFLAMSTQTLADLILIDGISLREILENMQEEIDSLKN